MAKCCSPGISNLFAKCKWFSYMPLIKLFRKYIYIYEFLISNIKEKKNNILLIEKVSPCLHKLIEYVKSIILKEHQFFSP